MVTEGPVSDEKGVIIVLPRGRYASRPVLGLDFEKKKVSKGRVISFMV